MLKTTSGHYFLRNNRTPPSRSSRLQESHDMFSFMFSCIFNESWTQVSFHNFGCLFSWLLTLSDLLVLLLLDFISVTNKLDEIGFMECPNRYPVWVCQLVPSVFNGPQISTLSKVLFLWKRFCFEIILTFVPIQESVS